MEDFFKPLYKAHRRADVDRLGPDVLDVRDPTVGLEVDGYHVKRVGAYWVIDELPGARIYPHFLSEKIQQNLITECVREYTRNPEHLTNLDAHYSLERPILFFDNSAPSPLPGKPGTLVRDKIRWITLGGQYDWTAKVYPSFEPGTKGCPVFPESAAGAIASSLGIRADASIVNFYQQGDILSPHQDIAELSKKDLVSMSLGCAALFYIGPERMGVPPLQLLLRSGDVVVMGGASRAAWHGVGRVFAGTCPRHLYELSLGEGFNEWMEARRVNINVRQMV